MTIRLISFALICSATLLSGRVMAQPAGRTPQPKVGYIYIVGNDVTRTDVILEQLGLTSGQDLRAKDLIQAERNLAKLDIFALNSETGDRPTVEVLNRSGDEEFKDILVRVKEAKTWSVRRMIGLTSRGELVASIVFEERNFDPSRFPISWEDLISHRAFRGAGITLRVELIQVPLFPIGSPRLLQMGGLLLPLGTSGGTHVHRDN